MKTKKHVMGITSLFIIVLLSVVLSGCGKKTAVTPTVQTMQQQEQGRIQLDVDTQAAAPNPVSSTKASTNVIQNKQERELVLMFRSLLQMDKKSELHFSKAQAENLLPLIRQSTSDGEMSDENLKMIIDLLTKEQKLFYDDLNMRFQKFSGNLSPSGGKKTELTDEQRQKIMQDRPPPAKAFDGSDKSIEQQLIDLLESKTK
ncbi:MAG: hypothetical protein JWM44_3016 [Bacilli bacterium]|nr:hypothetical protein [Bacilli bacterium]